MLVNGEHVDASFARKMFEDIYSRLIMLLANGTLRGDAIYSETLKLKERYRMDFIYTIRPSEFVNPLNRYRIKMYYQGKDLSLPFIVNIYNDTGDLVGDCYSHYRDVAISELRLPSEENLLNPPVRYWYNHTNGELTWVMLTTLDFGKSVSYSRQPNGTWKLDHGNIPIASLPRNLAQCKILLGETIPFQVDASKQLYDFLVRAGLVQLQEDILRIWPCKKCQKPKSSHRGNALKGYEPYPIS